MQAKQKELDATGERLNRLEIENQKLKSDSQDKEEDLQTVEERFNRLKVEKRQLETENLNYGNDLYEAQKKLQSRDRENQKLKSDLQEKQNVLEEFEDLFNQQEISSTNYSFFVQMFPDIKEETANKMWSKYSNI